MVNMVDTFSASTDARRSSKFLRVFFSSASRSSAAIWDLAKVDRVELICRTDKQPVRERERTHDTRSNQAIKSAPVAITHNTRKRNTAPTMVVGVSVNVVAITSVCYGAERESNKNEAEK